MQKTWIIFKNELIQTITRKSFLITLFIVPVVSAVIGMVISVLGENTSQTISQVISEPAVQTAEGYVDLSGIIHEMPGSISPDSLRAYTTLDAANADLSAGKIQGYYVIAKDYLENGNISYYRLDFNPITGMDRSAYIQDVLTYNLLGQDTALADRINNPVNLEVIYQDPNPQRDSSDALTFFLPYIVMMLFYMVIFSSSSLMLSSITKEKENRVMEIILSSASPVQLLTGKITALGVVGLIQTVVWTGTGLALLNLSGSQLNLSAAFQLPVSILAWGIVFFILGYALYASLMAGIGAMAPNLREASQVTSLMVLPMILPLMVLSSIVAQPNGPLSVGLSLFPLTSPITMITRLSIGMVPAWQVALSIILLVASAVIVVRAIAGMFRAQTLLSGQAINPAIFIKGLVGKLS